MHDISRRFSIGESENMQVTAAVFPQHPDTVLSSVICNLICFSGLCFNNFLFVYAYSNFTNGLHEGRVDFSLLIYIITKFCKPY